MAEISSDSHYLTRIELKPRIETLGIIKSCQELVCITQRLQRNIVVLLLLVLLIPNLTTTILKSANITMFVLLSCAPRFTARLALSRKK